MMEKGAREHFHARDPTILVLVLNSVLISIMLSMNGAKPQLLRFQTIYFLRK